MKTFKHGLSAYGYHKCRCTIFKQARAAYRRTPAGKAAKAAYRQTPAYKAYQAAYRQSPAGKASHAKYNAKILANPADQLKQIARSAISHAIRDGKLLSQPCEVCGEPKAQAHHKDYTKPLTVNWLCAKHHRQEYARIIWQRNYIKEI